MANTFKFGNGQWAVGKETALAYNDENNNFKPLPFSFDRGSIATVVNKDGLIETVGVDEPRIDFLNNPKGHLLLEPQRTNSFLQSNNFNTSWSVSNATLTGGQSGVGGGNDAWLFTASSGTNEKKIFQSSPLSGNVAVSVYAKKGTNDYLWLRGVTSGFAIRTWFNLSTGQVATDNAVSSEMVDMGNGWYRCIAIFNQDAGWDFHIGNSNQDNQVSVNTTGTIYIQYAQSETGSYATSYIPTSGSAVTRSAETTSQTVPDGVIGQTEGTVYMDFIAQNSAGQSQSHFWLGASGNEIGLYGGGQFIFYSSGGVSINGDNVVTGQRYKVAFGYKANDYVAYINGSQVGTDTGATVPTMYGLALNSYFNGSEVQKKNISDFKLYNTRLSNSELQALTTI